MDIYPNITLFVQIANFLFLLFVLNMIFYRPIRGILGRRSEEVKGLHERIGDFREKSDQYDKELEESYKEARGEGFREKDELKKAGVLVEKEVLQEAISSAEKRIGKAKDDIELTLTDVRQSLESELNVFSKELAEKILGRSI
jgi:F-type H+-transporting ATPase subunit b